MSDELKDQQRDYMYSAEVLGTELSKAAQDNSRGKQLEESNKIEDEFAAKGLYQQDIIEPPYNPEVLTTIYEQSSILPQCITAMKNNVHGYGFTLEPEPGVEPDEDGKYPEEVERERRMIKNFFEYCNPDQSFTNLRKNSDQDLRVVGYAFWELLRNVAGEIAGIEHLPAYTVRLSRLHPEPQNIDMITKDEEGNLDEIPVTRRFRRFVQIKDNVRVWFKEFGDPRDLDAETGKFLTPAEAEEVRTTGKLQGRPARLATEILYFKNYSSRTPYGVPEWIGSLPSVLGERAADEVNLNYFDNKAVPPLAVLVSGRLAGDSKKVIQEHVEKNIKGRNNFHSILLLEAEAPPNPTQSGNQRASIEMKPLTEAIQKDALFMDYTKQSRQKVRSSFRLPPIYVGESDDYTRATAEESREVAEEQVYGPERDHFDFFMNRSLLITKGVKYWKFKSLAPTQDNADKLAEIVEKLSKSGLTPREARQVMAEIFNKEFQEPNGENNEWLDEPIQVYTAKLTAGMTKAQLENAEKQAQEALERAKQQGNQQQEEGGQGGNINKSEGIQEFVESLVEIRKRVYDYDQDEQEPTQTY